MQDPFASFLNENDRVEADGIVFGPGFVWPAESTKKMQVEILGDSSFFADFGIRELNATIEGDAEFQIQFTHELDEWQSSGDSSFSADLFAGSASRVTQIVVEAMQASTPSVRTTQVVVEAIIRDSDNVGFFLTINGDSSFTAELAVEPFHADWYGDSSWDAHLDPYIYSAGQATVFLGLDNGFNELSATITGDSTFTAQPGLIIEPPYLPVNYPLGHGDDNIVELSTAPIGYAEVSMDLAEGSGAAEMSMAADGDATFTATMDSPEPFGVVIEGDSVFLAELYVDTAAELACTINGDAIFYTIGNPTVTTGVYDESYYIYGNVIAGYDPTDLSGGLDGDIKDFARFLGLYTNIIVGFDYTDDASANPGFVSQSYPDGDIIRDFARFKAQYVNITEGDEGGDCRLTVGPAPRGFKDLTPTARPPRKPASKS